MNGGMSAFGTKQTSACALHMSALGASGHGVLHCTCPLMTQSGHETGSQNVWALQAFCNVAGNFGKETCSRAKGSLFYARDSNRRMLYRPSHR